MLKIGITGSAGSGKSRVCRRLAFHGVPVVSCDVLARQAAAPGTAALRALVEKLGDDILDGAGALDRAKLRRLISVDSDCRKQVESIIQPAVLTTLFQEMAAACRAGHRIVAAEVPLLFELQLANRFDRVVAVVADPGRLVRRIVRRDGVTSASAQALLALQMSQQEKAAMAHVVISNNGTDVELDRQVDQFYFALTNAFA